MCYEYKKQVKELKFFVMVHGQCVILNTNRVAKAMTSASSTWQMFESMLEHAVTLHCRIPSQFSGLSLRVRLNHVRDGFQPLFKLVSQQFSTAFTAPSHRYGNPPDLPWIEEEPGTLRHHWPQ